MKCAKSEEKIEIGGLENLGDPPEGVPPIANVWLRHCPPPSPVNGVRLRHQSMS